MDILAHFRTLLRDVDTSLLEEWESLTQPGAAAARAGAVARQAVDPVAERRALHAAHPRRAAQAGARARAQRLRGGVAPAGGGDRRALDGGTPDGGDGAVLGGHTELLTTPAARRPDRTRIDPLDAGRLRVQQTLVDAEGDEDWSLDCVVDVQSAGGPPAIQLQRIGI